MLAQELLLIALDQRSENYRAAHRRCQADFSEDAVHDLRVATRRLLALFDLLCAITPHPRLQKLRRSFKDQLDSLDELRDTQVMLAEISGTIETLPGLVHLQKTLQKREKRLLKTADIEIREFKLSANSRRMEKVRADLLEKSDHLVLSAQLLASVDKAFSKVSRRLRQVDPAQSATIHRVRVAFKKFRYMLEIIYPILPSFPDASFKRMHDYQTTMGNIQDVEVMLRTLDNFSAVNKTHDLQPVRDFYQQRHADLIQDYIGNMNEFRTFWRQTPEKPFTWEVHQKEKI